MSANNQTLIKKYGDKFLVFENVNAESWGWDEEKNVPADNELYYLAADGVCKDIETARVFAEVIEDHEPTEYGVVEEVLFKDSGKVVIK